ncbi:MAG: phosphoenolpyruvate carboxylase, partial [Planctomycetota bacterium]|nr:phosphoenolpyruvate carboxylase [Planctomycetota bacterium]
MTEPLHRDLDWLKARMAEVETPETTAALDDLRKLVGAPDPGRPPVLDSLSTEAIGRLLTHLAIGFHLRNKAEQHHIVRVNRRRELEATPETPRAESIDEACRTLASRGLGAADVETILGRLDIEPTLTAHPTEARRRSVIRKQARIGQLLAILEPPERTPAEI